VRLFYFPGENGVTNFGDELNHVVWSHFLPGAFDDDGSDETQFVGIGTLLNDRLPPAARTVVFGSGVGYYGPPQLDRSWQIHCVRGPLSAAALGISADAAITDPGALVARLPRARRSALLWSHAFMPHFQSEPDAWRDICRFAGVGFIDPRWPPHRVLDAIAATGTLVAEAMHGAIVADALRVPWVPVRTRGAIKTFKWDDWCRSMEMEYRPCVVPPVWPAPDAMGWLRRARRAGRLALVARALRHVARTGRPLLSSDRVLESRLCRLEERLELLRSSGFGMRDAGCERQNRDYENRGSNSVR
jgi:succinoglycan biosynthesis protein ExoV